MAMVDFKEEELELLKVLVEGHVEHSAVSVVLDHGGYSIAKNVVKDDLLTKLKYGITVAKGAAWK